MNDLATDPRSALAAYITEIENEYLPWYERATNLNYYGWFIAQIVSFASGVVTAVIAALLKSKLLSDGDFATTALITVPLIGSLAATYLVQSRVAELEALRERGRETVQRLASEARAKFAAASTPEQFSSVHLELVALIDKLEQEQARGFHSLIPRQISFK